MLGTRLAWGAAVAVGFLLFSCRETQRDYSSNNAGASGNAGSSASAGSSTSAGSTASAGSSGASNACGADLSSDSKNCGSCGHDCTALPNIGSIDAVTCAAGQCVISATACATGYAHCSATADDGCETDVRTPEHCGDCETTCAADEPLCTAAGCAASCPAEAATVCGQTCVDVNSDPKHCGDCATICPAPLSGGSATCVDTACGIACLPTFTECPGNTCLDLQNDPQNCGACGNDCAALPNVASAAGVQCVAGACVVPTTACAPGFEHCSADGNDGCETDITVPAHCRGCDTTCPAGNPICTPDGCKNSCPANAPTLCNGTSCSDLTSDAQHCGDCAKTCPATQVCSSSKCGCPQGQNLCGTACKQPTDLNACGPSCIKCTPPTGGSITCDGTKCGAPTCPSGKYLCDNACVDNNKPCGGDCQGSKFLCPDSLCRDTNLITSCGQSCQPCPAKANATANSCSGSTCSYICNNGFMECTDKTCGRTVWDFDTGTTQGWFLVNSGSGGQAIASTTKKVSGTHSLAGEQVDGDFWQVFFETDICSGQSTSLLARNFSAQVLMDMTPKAGGGQSGHPNPYLCFSWKDSTGTYHFNGCSVPDKSGWYKFTGDFANTIPNVTGLRLEVNLGSGWTGRMYMDDAQLFVE